MQVQFNVTFDLGTAGGRAEFERMFGHLFATTVTPRKDHGPILAGEPPPDEPARANPSSIPDDPARAAAARAGRQEAAAKARAAKVAKQQPGPVETVLGPTDDDALGPTGNGDGLEVEDLGLLDEPDPSMSPGEAREAGLALVREAYAAGKVAPVKTLQKAWGIAKFYDIPVEKGHEFYRQVMKLAVETGLRK